MDSEAAASFFWSLASAVDTFVNVRTSPGISRSENLFTEKKWRIDPADLGVLEVGQRVCNGEKKDGKPASHTFLKRIAKMANLYQYCTPFEANRWFSATWVREERGIQNRNDFFTLSILQQT
ncbi:MAG TPA: hypothetical protein VFT90_03135 [Chryseosolibacter sp.]|nr:hypothetical protein [Chryseosolibacter sp.]